MPIRRWRRWVVAAVAVVALVVGVVFARGGETSKSSSVIPSSCSRRATDEIAVAASPSIVIGADEDDPRYQTAAVNSAARLLDGSIAIADDGFTSIRLYDSTGDFRRTIGRRGGGPGEFEEVSYVQAGAGDSLFVFDRRQQRYTIFDTAGAVLAEGRLAARGRTYNAVSRLANGQWLAQTFGTGGTGPVGSLVRDTVQLLALNHNGTVADRLDDVPGMLWANVSIPGGERGTMPAPFAPRSLHAASRSCVYAVSGDEPEVRVTDARGGQRWSVSVGAQADPVTDAQFQAWIAMQLADASPEEQALGRAILQETPRPDRLPLYNTLIVDSEGLIWLETYTPPTGASGRWRLLDPAGMTVATVELPAGLAVFQIGRDFVLGRFEDAAGRELVVLYNLSRPESLTRRSDPRCQA